MFHIYFKEKFRYYFLLYFRDATLNRAPDTYVKLSLVSSTGQEMTRSKTSIRRAQPNPLFKETFMFQVILSLNNVNHY